MTVWSIQSLSWFKFYCENQFGTITVSWTHYSRIKAYWSKLHQGIIGWKQDLFRQIVDLKLLKQCQCFSRFFCFIAFLRKECICKRFPYTEFFWSIFSRIRTIRLDPIIYQSSVNLQKLSCKPIAWNVC